MLYQQNILLQPIQKYIVTEDQLRKVDEIIKESRASQFYVRTLIRKCFGLMHPRYWLNYYLLKRHFGLFVMGLLSQKQQKVRLCFKKQCITKLKNYINRKNKERQRVEQYHDSISRGKLRLILKQWKEIAQLQTATKRVQQSMLKSSFKEFLDLLKENHSLMKRKQIEVASEMISLQDIYCQKIVRQAFQNLKINTKLQRLKKRFRSKYFRIFKSNMKQQNNEDRIKGQIFFNKKVLSKCFLLWKEQCHMQIAAKFYTQRLIMSCFDLWKHQLPYLQSERQIEQNNEVIVKIYLEKRYLKLRDQSFRRWRQLAIYHKQLSHHNVLLNKFAQKQYRYVLLDRYFEKIRLNCLNNKVKLKYYQTKLKRKALDGFKIYFSKSIDREGLILDQIDRNLLKKYFNKIRLFNSIQQSKVRVFKLKKIFNRFATSIITEYCNKIDRADRFSKLNLLYKTLFSLKKTKLQTKQDTYAIVLVNIILPLRRWHRQFKIERYLNQKDWFLKKSIMRGWRMRVIRKDSQKKIVREFKEIESARKTVNSEQKMEVFQFENIMATIAQIRNNINSGKDDEQQQSKGGWYGGMRGKVKQHVGHTPSQSINFSYSLEQYD